LKTEEDSYSLYIIFTSTPDCQPKIAAPYQSWIIIVIIIGVIVGVALIFIAIVLIVPSLRKIVFPYQRRNQTNVKLDEEFK